ncbi:MAG: hexose kinase [Chitinophagaceae bacterium]
MGGIITTTFSPCIDKSTSIPSLIPEKKLRCSSPRLEPGGGGINVARAIKKLGGEAIAIFPAGGYTGKHFTKLMTDEGIHSVIIETTHETRENIVVVDESANKQYRFGMPGTFLKENEWQQILQRLEESTDVGFIVASGSLPPGVPTDIFARIARIAKLKKAKLIVDTSGEALKYAVEEGVYLIKPNLGELSALVNQPHLHPHEILPAANILIAQSNCEVIVASMGAAGAMLITKNKTKTITSPFVHTKSTVGAGDSMVAGIVLSLSKGKSIEEAVRFGVACGTAATMNPGTELCRSEDAEKLFRIISTYQEHSYML